VAQQNLPEIVSDTNLHSNFTKAILVSHQQIFGIRPHFKAITSLTAIVIG
jgi:hypothetical protein